MLEECGASFYGDFVQLLAIFEGLLDPSETNSQQFTIDGVDTDLAEVVWSLDLDGDQMPDLFGTLQFAQEEGDPEPAADVSLLAGGFDDLDAMLAALPDGTRINFGAARAEPPPMDATFTFVIVGRAADSVSMNANTQDLDCLLNIGFADVPFQDVGGDYPNLTATLDIATGDGAVEGTVAFNGTSQARIEVSVGSETDVHAFTIDLETGVVTPAS
ncbi:MAG: hypothetical protein ACYTGU_14560 [Planctomycetota bacterium]